MRKMLCVLLVASVFACSDDDSGGDQGGGDQAEVGFLEQWQDQNPELVEATYEGEPILLDEAEQTIYVADCDVADEATSQGHEYGPADGETGWASICPSD